MTCRICGAPVLARELCSAHYNRLRRDPTLTDAELAQPTKQGGRRGATTDQEATVRHLHASFVPRREIARRVGLTPTQVSWILQPKPAKARRP